MRSRLLITILVVLPVLNSCRTISSFVHDGEVVAEVGAHKLYSGELAAFIPSGISSEDSTKLALQYINTWASDLIFMDTAEKELTKEDLDVSRELEDYKRSLLKYRYEQLYINQRLDTVVTSGQVNAYYESHQDQFVLDFPIVKARYMRVPKTSPRLAELRKVIVSADGAELDSVAFSSALRYSDYGGKWVSSVTLARDFGTDYATLLSSVKNGYVEKENEETGNVDMAYLTGTVKAGAPGPVEYYSEMIKDILLGTRKQALISGLERDLLQRARDTENLVIH